MDTANQFLGTERIGKLMQKYSAPCIISLLVGALYNRSSLQTQTTLVPMAMLLIQWHSH